MTKKEIKCRPYDEDDEFMEAVKQGFDAFERDDMEEADRLIRGALRRKLRQYVGLK